MLSFANFPDINKVSSSTYVNNSNNKNSSPAGKKFFSDNKKLIYASLGALAVLGTAGTIVYNIRKGKMKGNEGQKISETISETVNEIIPEKVKRVGLPKSFSTVLENKIPAKKFFNLKSEEIPSGFTNKTKAGCVTVYDYGDGISITSQEDSVRKIKKLILKKDEQFVGRMSFNLNTKEIRKTVFEDTTKGLLENVFVYDKNGKLTTTKEILTSSSRVRTKTTLADGTATVVEKDKKTGVIKLEEWYDKDGSLMRSKMDGEWIVIDETCVPDKPVYVVPSAGENGITFRNGKAIGIDGRIYTGTLERSGSSGRFVTRYKDGLIAERDFFPNSGNIKQVNKTYSRDDNFVHINTKKILKDESVSYEYCANIVEKPNYFLKGLFKMSDFNYLKFDEIPGSSYSIETRNGKKIVKYSNDINIEYETLSSGTKVIRLKQHKTKLRSINILEHGTREIWNADNSYCVAYRPDGQFSYWKQITRNSDGGYTADVKYADGTRQVTQKDSSKMVISRVTYDAEGKLIS